MKRCYQIDHTDIKNSITILEHVCITLSSHISPWVACYQMKVGLCMGAKNRHSLWSGLILITICILGTSLSLLRYVLYNGPHMPFFCFVFFNSHFSLDYSFSSMLVIIHT